MHKRVSALLLAGLLPVTHAARAEDGLAKMPDPVDPQSWVLPEWMTWADYRPIPGVDWNAPERQPAKKLRAALILGDFSDREFVVTLPEGGDVLGLDGLHNPIGVGGIAREEVGEFYADFLIREPSALNGYHTVNEYWLEDSYGLIGVDAEAFGPYRMPGKEHEYGLSDQGAGASCPTGDSCNKDFDTDLITASLADVTAGIALNGGEDYDFRFLLHAGYDESGVWQEFGEMLFPGQRDVTDLLGNPDPTKENWANTRYVPWTSFAAAESIWSHALPGVTSTQGESDGGAVFAHELSHIFGVLDNYNNPFSVPARRSYTGLWAMLSRGSFNGPGGNHTRWQIPPAMGSSMGSHHMLRNKMRLGFLRPGEVMEISGNALAVQGPQIATIYPRAYPLFPVTEDVGLHGMHVLMDQDSSPSCNTAEQYDCDGGGYRSYTVEVVDRIGFDSFCPDHGVLIAKNKDGVDLPPFIWAIDAHPEDINTVTPPAPNQHRQIYDFIRPQVIPDGLFLPTAGEQVPISIGDARQLADALFHAGTGEGVVSEYLDEPNGLHFYVLGLLNDARGFRSYRVAVRSTAGGGAFVRGLQAAQAAAGRAAPGRVAEARFAVTNTGTGVDLVRVAARSAAGWETQLQHRVYEVAAGATVEVPVYVAVPSGARVSQAALEFTAQSETAPLATATVTGALRVSQAGREQLAGGGAADTAPRPGAGGAPGGLWLALLALGLCRRHRPGG